jgi:hypothetical protein
MRRLSLLLVLLSATSAFAQEWHVFGRGAVFATSVTETGPANPENRFFSTNWLEAGVRRSFGDDFSVELRGRGSLEPYTVPREGYPQLLQYVSAESGGPLIDHMRAQDALQEALVRMRWRVLRVDLAPVADPPLGSTSYAQRASSIDFAEAPFAYDVQESFHLATKLAGGAVDTKFVTVEGAVFHAATTTGRHSTIPNGNVDSWSGRVTVHPTPALSIQASRGELGDERRQVSSAAVLYEGAVVAASAIWTRRDPAEALRGLAPSLNALTAEVAFRARHNVLELRAEQVDRPAGTIYPTLRRTSHLTVGDVVDFIHVRNVRAGVGVNIDYQTQTRELRNTYGHKPQTVYLFFRARTE